VISRHHQSPPPPGFWWWRASKTLLECREQTEQVTQSIISKCPRSVRGFTLCCAGTNGGEVASRPDGEYIARWSRGNFCGLESRTCARRKTISLMRGNDCRSARGDLFATTTAVVGLDQAVANTSGLACGLSLSRRTKTFAWTALKHLKWVQKL